MLLRDLLRRSGRSLRSAKARTLLTALAIAVGTFALALTLAASNGATAFVNKLIAENFDPAELIVTNDAAILGRVDQSKPREYDSSLGTIGSGPGATTQIKRLADDDLAKLRQVSQIEAVREQITISLQYLTRPDQKKYVGTVEAFSPYERPEVIAGEIVRPVGNKQLLLPEAYVSVLGFSDAQAAIGKSVSLTISKTPSQSQIQKTAAGIAAGQTAQDVAANSSDNSFTQDFTIAAVLKKPTTSQPGTELNMYIGLDDARALNDIATKDTNNYRKYNYVFAKVTGGTDQKVLSSAQEDIKKLGYTTRSVKETQAFLTNIIGVLQGIVAGFGAIAIIASVFGIINTMYISVLQRTREIGLMKALGMHKRDIGRLFRFEAAWIGFIGGTIGTLAALATGTALNPWITSKLDLGKGNVLLIFKPTELVILVVMLMVVSILAGWLPSRKAAKLDPIEALRTE